MDTLNKLEVFILYCSSLQSDEIPFTKIIQSKNSIDADDFEPSMFWGVLGGFEIVFNNYNSIFHSSNFHHLVKATSFLIHSLYWIEGKKTDWFDVDDDYPNDVIIRTTSNELVRLQNFSSDSITLSFTSSDGNIENQRGDRYFEKIKINKADWLNAVIIALDEYFEVLLRVIDANKNDKICKTMMSYYEVFASVRGLRNKILN